MNEDRQQEEVDPARLAYGRTVPGPEDTDLCESVPRGLHAPVYKRGRNIVDPKRRSIGEQGIYHFHHTVRTALGR